MNARDYQTLLLCSFMHNRQNFTRLASEISEDNFTIPELNTVYKSMLELGPKFGPTDLAESTSHVGGLALVRDISESYLRYGLDKSISFRDSRKFALAVEKHGRLHYTRRLLEVALKGLGQYDGEGAKKSFEKFNDEKFVSTLVSELISKQYQSTTRGFKSYDHYLFQYALRLKRLLTEGVIEDRLATGWNSFNTATGGGLPKGLTVLAGPPGSGKTQWSLQAVVDIAKRLRDDSIQGVCAINSAEMEGTDLISRAVLSAAEIDSSILRTGGYKDDKGAIKRILTEMKNQKSLPIFIDDSEFLTSNIIKTRVTGLKAKYKYVVLVVTDFAEIVVDSGDNQEQKVASVFINSKILQRLLGCSVIVLSHVNRGVEMSGSKVPSMNNIRYSGMAGQIADLVDLIYYPSDYEEKGIKITQHPDMPSKKGVAYHIIAKHRNGPTGILPMGWDPVYTHWYDLKSKKALGK